MTNFSSITFSSLKNEIETYLKQEHNKANVLFSPASPYGQILMVLENLHQLSILYLKNTINQFDISSVNANNERVIKNTAILAGHIPGRAISSTGTIKLVKKTSIDIEKELPSGIVTFDDKIALKNKTNGLFYSLNLGKIKLEYNIKSINIILLPIIQGEYRLKVFTGDGTIMQTYTMSELGEKDIENFNVSVLVNGIFWTVKKHIYDLLPDEEACVVRTGFNGGIDVIFGNGGFGKIPEIASNISIRYLATDGQLGNIYRRTFNDWTFVDDVYDVNGRTVDIEKIFDIEIYNDINFGSNKEDYLFTKSLLPIASNNFVLALPQQYAYQLKRLGVFSYVNADEKNGTIFIYISPNINLFKRQDENYFDIPMQNTTDGTGQIKSSAFELDSYEKSKIVDYLKSGGNIQLTKKFIVKSPSLSLYTMNVWIINYSDSTQDSVKSQIVSAISDYFLTFNRIDRIPKSDIIRILSDIEDINSVKVEFTCKKNEDYHIEGIKSLTNRGSFEASKFFSNPSNSQDSYDPNKILGLDPQLGDIIFDANEMPVIRGGWYDRNGSFITDENPLTSSNLTGLNIFFKGTVDTKNRNGI
jgi:hypothetical protein